jgi:uncharacterized protein (TIGR02453 family)
MAGAGYFTKETFRFLRELARNNRRDWFDANRSRYEEHVRIPALRLIEAFAPHLSALSPHFHAGPRSLFRIHKDTRFSKDKSPYKTHVGIQFRHDQGQDVHAPGYYFHVEPRSVFVALGLWHPDGPSLRRIRERIVDEPGEWKQASGGPRFTRVFTVEGERLSRVPRGFDPEHPLADDLKWKDFIATRELDEASALSPALPRELARVCAAGSPYMSFLCKAVGVPF